MSALTNNANVLLRILEEDPDRTIPVDELVRRMRVPSSWTVNAAASELREHRRQAGRHGPANVWGVGFRLNPYEP